MSQEYKPFVKEINFKNNIIDSDFDLILSKYENQPLFNLGYHYYTKQVRDKMDNLDFKKRNFYLIANEFENVTPDYEEGLDNLISKKFKLSKNDKILSRDFYKLWEIITYFDLITDKSIKTVCISENGGFLQSICYFRDIFFKKNSDLYTYENSNNKTSDKTVKKFKEVEINRQSDGPIEVFERSKFENVENIESFIKKNKLKADINLITANGVSQYDTKSNRECQSYKLFLGQIILAISLSKNGGDFVMRTEDFLTTVTLKLINILGNCYKKVYVSKPLFSRSYLNEKYIVCKNFNLKDSNKEKLLKKLKNLLNQMNEIESLFILDIKKDYKIDINDINSIIDINQELIGKEHMTINKIVDYKNKKNYFGEQYHKYKNSQVDAIKWWYGTYIKDKISDLNNLKVI